MNRIIGSVSIALRMSGPANVNVHRAGVDGKSTPRNHDAISPLSLSALTGSKDCEIRIPEEFKASLGIQQHHGFRIWLNSLDWGGLHGLGEQWHRDEMSQVDNEGYKCPSITPVSRSTKKDHQQ